MFDVAEEEAVGDGSIVGVKVGSGVVVDIGVGVGVVVGIGLGEAERISNPLAFATISVRDIGSYLPVAKMRIPTRTDKFTFSGTFKFIDSDDEVNK